MATVYITLHSEYAYAIALIDGDIDVKDYIENVDWLRWLFPYNPNRRQIEISGGPKHLERAAVFAQRMKATGAEILARENKKEEWFQYEVEKMPDEKLIQIECEADNEPKKIRWAKSNIENYKKMLVWDGLDEENRGFWESLLQQEENKLRELEDIEPKRIGIISNFWKVERTFPKTDSSGSEDDFSAKK